MVTLKSLLKDVKGVLFHSPSGNSEYSEVGKRTVYQMCKQDISVSWYRFETNDSEKNENVDSIYQSINETLNKNIEFDVAVFCCNPDIWNNHIEKYKIKFQKKKIIGYFSWDTDKLPDLWVKYCNLIDEIWVPSKFNKEILEKCGVEIPINIFPYPFIEKSLLERNSESLNKLLSISKWYGGEKTCFNYSSDYKIYYALSEWTDLKNAESVLKSFCKTFISTDKVKLILKIHHLNYTNSNKLYCINQLETLLKKFPNHPEILLITENISYQDILLIHSMGDCYISLSRGEGFCLDAWDAFNYKKDIIITSFGGHCDYLGKNYKGYVNYKLIDVNFEEKKDLYKEDQLWADPFLDDCVNKLKNLYIDVKNQQIESVLLLKNGWYFKEQKNGVYFRQTSCNPVLVFNENSYDYIKFKLRYENGDSTKNLSVLIDSLIKRDFVLTKNTNQEVLIPVSGVKQISFFIKQDTSEVLKKDHRNLGFLLENVSLIKNNSVSICTLDKIPVENELTEFCNYSEQELELQKIVEFDKAGLLFSNNESEGLKSKIIQFRVKNDSEFKGIVYIGQYGTSGYATAAKGNLIHFFTKGIPVSWIPLYFDNSQLSDECFYNVMVKSLIKNHIENCDTVFIHSTPDIWPDIRNKHKELLKNKKVIGYTVWETNKLPYLWVESINDCVDEVWCPSSYNKTVFFESGVKIPIKVFPHVFMPKELPSKKSVIMNILGGEIIDTDNTYYTFYNISELNCRKGVEDLVKTFCESFSAEDKVRLILKVHYKNYEDKNKKYCISVLNDIISGYNNPPKIHIILNNLTEREILGLHSIGDCYVSLCKSEGFGLTIFEAFNYKKEIITTGYGGHLDFLGKNHKGLIKYTLENVTGMDEFSKHYSEDQKWAYPDLNHAKELMIKSSK